MKERTNKQMKERVNGRMNGRQIEQPSEVKTGFAFDTCILLTEKHQGSLSLSLKWCFWLKNHENGTKILIALC